MGFRVNRRRVPPLRSEHQRDEPAAAGNFEFAEDGVNMLFYHCHTQMCRFGDLLVALSVANKSRNLLFPRGKPGENRQVATPRCAASVTVATQVFALNQEMWSDDAS